jgi:hypothetical protein
VIGFAKQDLDALVHGTAAFPKQPCTREHVALAG